MKPNQILLTLIVALMSPICTTATTYYARVSGDWSAGDTWSTVSCGGASAGAIPTSCDSVVICGGYTVGLGSGNDQARAVNVTGASSRLNIANGDYAGWPQMLTCTNLYIDNGGYVGDKDIDRSATLNCTNLYIGTKTPTGTSATWQLDNYTNNGYVINITNLVLGDCRGSATFDYTPELYVPSGSYQEDASTISNVYLFDGGSYNYAPTGTHTPAAPSPTTTSYDCFFVNDASTTGDYWSVAVGNDANAGTSAGAPKLTLASLLSSQDLDANDIVCIDHGTYSWTGIDWSSSATNDYGSAGGPLEIRGAGTSGTYITDITSASGILFEFPNSSDGYDYIDFTHLKLTGANGSDLFYFGQPDNVKIRFCDLSTVGSGAAIHVYNDADNIKVLDNTIFATGTYAVQLEQSAVNDGFKLRRNKIDGGGAASIGFYTDQACSNLDISNNYISNFLTGIDINAAVTTSTFQSNSIYAQDRCFTGRATFSNIRNNIFYIYGGTTGDVCVDMDVADSPTLDYNLYYYPSATCASRNGSTYSTLSDWQHTFSSNDANSPTASDPLFVAPGSGDLSVPNTSPAAEAGLLGVSGRTVENSFRTDPTHDYIGAYESQEYVTLASDNPATASASWCPGASQQEGYSFNLTSENESVEFNSLTFTTTNSSASDIHKYQLWSHTSNDLSAATQLGSDITTSLGSGDHTFAGFISNIPSCSTVYFWVTVDVVASPTANNTLIISAIDLDDIGFNSITANESGTASAGGTQTFLAGVAANISSGSYSGSYMSSTPLFQVNSTTTAYGSFVASNGSSGGYSSAVDNGTIVGPTGSVTTSGVVDAAPDNVYLSERWHDGTHTYTLSGFENSTKYFIRLHFNEGYHDNINEREFDVTINGTQVLNDYDMNEEVGKNTADIKEFVQATDGSGELAIAFVKGSNGNPLSRGIEVYEAGYLTASGGGAYLWNTGSTDATLDIGYHETTYTVTVTNGGCTATESFEVSSGNVLPVDLTNLQVNCGDDGQAIIEWTTAAEVNNQEFEVLKSTDGKNFELLQVLVGALNSSTNNQYRAEDKEFNTQAYYQLKQLDIDGDFEVFPTVFLSKCLSVKAGVFMESAFEDGDHQIQVRINNGDSNALILTVFDAQGRTIYREEKAGQRAATQLNIPAQTWATGVYHIVVQIGGALLSKPVMKK